MGALSGFLGSMLKANKSIYRYTCYTERYMSTPQPDPEGYMIGSCMEAVANLKPFQKLLLIHGLTDKNVHFRHTARLITAPIGVRLGTPLATWTRRPHLHGATRRRVRAGPFVRSYGGESGPF